MGNLLKKPAVFLLLFLFLQTQSWALSPRETIMQLLKDYSPTGYYIVNQYETAPEDVEFQRWKTKFKKSDFMSFVRGDAIQDLLRSINTVVHETAHSYILVKSYQLCKDRKGKSIPGYDAYYIGNETNITVKITPIFNTTEIIGSIPESLRTFRFKTYVSDESDKNIRSKTAGVYGLLDEYHAYYHGNKAAFDLYPYYRDKMPETPEKWHNYFYGVNGTFAASMEFEFYILKYLQYAKANYPKIYRDILRNKDFCAAFFAIKQNHAQLGKDYFQVKEEIFEMLRQKGYTVSEDERFCAIGKDHILVKTNNNMESYFLLQREMEKEEYQVILKELETAL